MSASEKIKLELRALLEEGVSFLSKEHEGKPSNIAIKYQSWYTRVVLAVKQLVPDRLDDLISQYHQPKRKESTPSTYTIDDYLHGIIFNNKYGDPQFETYGVFYGRLMHQIGILRSAIDVSESRLRDIYTTLQFEILDQDVFAAKELLKAKHLRSAGVVCGVALEAHLKSVAKRGNIEVKKKNPTISDLNDLLKEGGIYDISLWRLIQRLGDIRNLCCHSKEREPKPDEVEDLISGAEKILKEVV